MTLPSIARLVPAPPRRNVAAATFATQLLGTFAFALALYCTLRKVEPFAVGLLVTGAFGVFAGGNAHRGSLHALALCIVFDLAIAVAMLARIPEVTAFVSVPLQRLSPEIMLTMTALGIVASLSAIACIAALPEARRFAAWRGAQVIRAARVAR